MPLKTIKKQIDEQIDLVFSCKLEDTDEWRKSQTENLRKLIRLLSSLSSQPDKEEAEQSLKQKMAQIGIDETIAKMNGIRPPDSSTPESPNTAAYEMISNSFFAVFDHTLAIQKILAQQKLSGYLRGSLDCLLKILISFIQKHIDRGEIQKFSDKLSNALAELHIRCITFDQGLPGEDTFARNNGQPLNKNDMTSISQHFTSATTKIVALLNIDIIHTLFNEMIADLTHKVITFPPEQLASQGYVKDVVPHAPQINLGINIKKCMQIILLRIISPDISNEAVESTGPKISNKTTSLTTNPTRRILSIFILAVGTGTANNNNALPQYLKDYIPDLFSQTLEIFRPKQMIPEDYKSALTAYKDYLASKKTSASSPAPLPIQGIAQPSANFIPEPSPHPKDPVSPRSRLSPQKQSGDYPPGPATSPRSSRRSASPKLFPPSPKQAARAENLTPEFSPLSPRISPRVSPRSPRKQRGDYPPGPTSPRSSRRSPSPSSIQNIEIMPTQPHTQDFPVPPISIQNMTRVEDLMPEPLTPRPVLLKESEAQIQKIPPQSAFFTPPAAPQTPRVPPTRPLPLPPLAKQAACSANSEPRTASPQHPKPPTRALPLPPLAKQAACSANSMPKPIPPRLPQNPAPAKLFSLPPTQRQTDSPAKSPNSSPRTPPPKPQRPANKALACFHTPRSPGNTSENSS